jgi:signal transduction histidine kinase/CheY-like chemotaxis protein
MVIIALSVFSIMTIYFSRMVERADNQYHQILKLEKDLSGLLITEEVALNNLSSFKKLKENYKRFYELVEAAGFDVEKAMLAKRNKFYEKLYTIQKEKIRLHTKVREILPSLVASVRYIHQHHIVYLKNLLRRGHITQDWDISNDFERSPVKSAPEVDIIQAAVGIQNKLLDVFTLFYKLQIEESPSELKNEFQVRIKAFYKAVNTFEDYSLDAQDGLLVEELLITGRDFEHTFTNLLLGEENIKQLTLQLAKNSENLFYRFHLTRQAIMINNSGMEKRLQIIQYVTSLAFGLLIVYLLFYRYKMVTAFQRTVEETEKIQNDIAYEIKIKKQDYEEFRIVFQAMNTMAGTIKDQIIALEKAGTELSQRVKERTAELEEANQRLKTEITKQINIEKKRMELETKLNRARKMEAIGMLAGGVAHDLNNILSGIVSYPEILLMDISEDSPLKKPLLTIKNSGEKAATIVQDLLTLARRGVAVTEIVNMNIIIEEYLKSIEFKKLQSYHMDVSVRNHLDDDLLNIIGSPVHLFKTVMNLVSNAAEAMPGGGTITIETKNQYIDQPVAGYDDVSEGDYVVVGVADDGIGISDEDMERIFEPFYTKKVMGRSGTGLGMAVIWGTVKDHNGYINVKSVKNDGTTITIYLPVTRKTATGRKKEIALDEIKGNGEKILVIDDVVEQREIATSMLVKLGYEVKSASSGEKAVIYLRDHHADLLLLDMIMDPGMDGLETYRQILKIHSHQKAIIASGFSETDRVRQAMILGAGAYVRKPYTLEKIGVAVYNELKRSKEKVK